MAGCARKFHDSHDTATMRTANSGHHHEDISGSRLRNCTAAIICVTADDGPVQSNFQLNQNVLIEIGAAFVLYDRRVILVWDKRLPVPSNLQGLYRCEFEGTELSWSKGMKLMEAVKQFRVQK